MVLSLQQSNSYFIRWDSPWLFIHPPSSWAALETFSYFSQWHPMARSTKLCTCGCIKLKFEGSSKPDECISRLPRHRRSSPLDRLPPP